MVKFFFGARLRYEDMYFHFFTFWKGQQRFSFKWGCHKKVGLNFSLVLPYVFFFSRTPITYSTFFLRTPPLWLRTPLFRFITYSTHLITYSTFWFITYSTPLITYSTFSIYYVLHLLITYSTFSKILKNSIELIFFCKK